MKTSCTIGLAFVVCLGLLAASARADTVITRSGHAISGRVQINGDEVRIENTDGTLTLPRARVDRVIMDRKTVTMPKAAPQAVRRAAPKGDVQANGGGADLSARKELEEILNRRISVRFDDTPLPDAIAYVQEITGLNFVYSRAEVQGIVINLNLDDVPVRKVLDFLVDQGELGWTIVAENIVKLGPPDEINPPVLVVYDTRDLLLNIEDKVAKRAQTLSESDDDDDDDDGNGQWGSDDSDFGFDSDDGDGGSTAGSPSADLADRAFGLATLITSTVRPETWAQPPVLQFGGATAATQEDDDMWDETW